MLNTLDVLIGFTLVMLVVSMAVTMLTQFMGTAVFDLRGRSLKAGVARLLALMDNGLTRRESKRIADHVLRNPLVGKARLAWNDGYGLASVIHREELVKLLLDFAVPGDATKADRQDAADEESLRHKLRRSLAGNGIADPGKVLDAVRTKVVELEKTNPEMSHSARLNLALLHHAESPYLSKLNSWFDQTIDRVSELFTRRIRLVTALAALALALCLQLDSVGLINRLSVDDQLRNRLVEKAATEHEALARRLERGEPAFARLGIPPAGEHGVASGRPLVPGTPSEAALVARGDRPDPLTEVRRTIEEAGIISLPRDLDQWRNAWWETKARGGGFRWPFLLGILLSAALLSLGAPFWYATLGNLLKMRSLIARKDEAQRTERQTTQVPALAAAVETRPRSP